MQRRRWFLRAAGGAAVVHRARMPSLVSGQSSALLREPPCAGLISCLSLRPALLASQRFQATSSTDKKYHCSICNKSFRLEMAAKVHLQQAHQGQGSVLTGSSGDGGDADDANASVAPPSHAPPSAPTVLSDLSSTLHGGLSTSGGATSPFMPHRKSRPVPKPLHEPENDLPDAVMTELLGVWDGIGVSRLGESFIHSSMIVKVSAGTPHAGAAAAHPLSQEGTTSGGTTAAYGQIPMYGQSPPSTPTAPLTVASPFAAAPSPFAAAVTSPFVQPPSPFVSGSEAADGSAPSPFAAAAAAQSPFVSADAAASPFAPDASSFGTFAPTASSVPFSPSAMASVPATPEAAPQIPCATCGKAFSSHDGMRMHAKAKHGVDIPREVNPKGGQTRQPRGVPDLPPYVPSPVDIQMTAPFGSLEAEKRWDETILRIHSVSVNNVLLLGTVAEVTRANGDTVHVAMTVHGDDGDETFMVQCNSSLVELSGVTAGCCACVQGTLRMRPTSDADGSSSTYAPLVVVSPSSGLIAKVDVG